MAGLFGFTSQEGHRESSAAQTTLQAMLGLLSHRPYYRADRFFWDGLVGAGRVHLGSTQGDQQPWSKNGIFVWLDGEFYNRGDLMAPPALAPASDGQILGELYLNDSRMEFLKRIDGKFAAVIYDQPIGKVHLVTDRYGLRYLFWRANGGGIAWSSEVKAFLGMPSFSPQIDREAVAEFFCVGQLTQDRTWFREVKLIPAGSVWSWDLRERSWNASRYWWWTDIKLMSPPIDTEAIAERLGQLFLRAVARRCCENESVGAMLSGGLDSRAIVAAMPSGGKPIWTATFGRKGCTDVRIARQVAKLKGTRQKVFEITSRNWLSRRREGTWLCDGHACLLDLHCIEMAEWLYGNMDYCMDGFMGDIALGGAYLSMNLPGWSEIEKINFRGRRFIAEAGRVESAFVIANRYPFCDNDVLELAFSVPPEYRKGASIYKKMLLKTFPEYYERIPWQKTSLPIGTPRWRDYAKSLSMLARARGCAALRRIGINKFRFNNSYVDYESWLRQEPARAEMVALLTSKAALFPEFIPYETVQECLARHLKGVDCTRLLGLYMTFEIWLQQVFHGRLRPDCASLEENHVFAK